MDSTIGFPNTYPLDSDLSVEQHYPTFEQTGARPQLLKRWITQLTLSTAWINLYPNDSTIGFPYTYPRIYKTNSEGHQKIKDGDFLRQNLASAFNSEEESEKLLYLFYCFYYTKTYYEADVCINYPQELNDMIGQVSF